MQPAKASSAIKPIQWLQYGVYGSVILYFGRTIFIPISFALLISFVLYPVCAWLERKGLNRALAILLSMSILIFLGLLLVALLVYQVNSFITEWPGIQRQLKDGIKQVSEMLAVAGISETTQTNFLTKLADQSGENLVGIIRNAIAASAFSFVVLVLVPVYAVLILYYREYWLKILVRLFPAERSESIKEIITLTVKAYYNFIKGMGIVYLIVGGLNSVGLLLLGVPHALLFGFVASVLTIVPYVGIIIGSLLPITMAWITYGSVWYPLGVIGVFTFVQYLEANVIFPMAVSSRLNVNTLVMLVAIFAGGVLWGVSGMILFVPFVGIAKLIADHNPKWKTASLILGIEPKNKKR